MIKKKTLWCKLFHKRSFFPCRKCNKEQYELWARLGFKTAKITTNFGGSEVEFYSHEKDSLPRKFREETL